MIKITTMSSENIGLTEGCLASKVLAPDFLPETQDIGQLACGYLTCENFCAVASAEPSDVLRHCLFVLHEAPEQVL